MSWECRIRLLMLFSVFVGSNSGQLDTSLLEDRWSPVHVQGLAPSARKSYSTGKKILWLLPSGREASPQWVTMPCGGMDIVSVCFLPWRLYPALIHESLPSHLADTIHLALDLSIHDHCMFWAACTLAYFRFLHSAEFTVPNLASFLPTIHLTVADIAVDSMVSPSCLRVRIKASKTDPFHVGFYVHVGLWRAPLCSLQAMLAFLALRGNSPGPLFLLQSGQPLTYTPGGKASMYVL